MINPCISYYKNQAGSGLPSFEGIPYQRGGNFFGNAAKYIYSNILKPIGNYLLPKAVETGTKIGTDFLEGEDLSSSVKKNLKRTAQEILNDGYKRADKFIQTGKGRRRRRSTRKPLKRSGNKPKSLLKKKKLKRQPTRKLRKKRGKSIKHGNIFKDLFK